MLQEGGVDHFKLTTRAGAARKPAERIKARRKLAGFWQKLTLDAHNQGIDVLELLDPVCDLCILLSGCA